MVSQNKMKVKICGITTVEDARLAAEVGADYIGVIVGVSFSPRILPLEQSRAICENSPLPVVILVFDWDADQIQEVVAVLKPHAVQLLGHESVSLVKTLKETVSCELWKTIHLPEQGKGGVNVAESIEKTNSYIDAGIDAVLIDTVVSSPGGDLRYGGTGQVSDWTAGREIVKAVSIPVFLAGGVNPDNVRQAIETVHPYGIDLCSGVEASIGRKDPDKMRRLMVAIRETDTRSSE